LDYARLLVNGTQWVPERALRAWLEPGVAFVPKRGSHPTELADLFSRDLYEWASSGCCSEPKWWDLLTAKIYSRGDGRMGKCGVKVFPDSDIQSSVLEHRASIVAAQN
jgi:hypothetical protein